METGTYILISLLVIAILYVATLAHLGRGNAKEMMEAGAKLILESLERQGRISPAGVSFPDEAVNIGEEDYKVEESQPLPDIIVARNKKHAEQIGDKLVGELMQKIVEESTP